MKIVVIGTGYVGLVAATCLSHLGHTIVGVDKDESKIASLKAGQVPIYEPRLGKLLADGMAAGKLGFATSLEGALPGAKVVIIAVGTPTSADGRNADLSALMAAARAILQNAKEKLVVVVKSTVPTGTWAKLEKLKADEFPGSEVDFASNPEFLREGSAIADFMKPDRIVIGVASEFARERLAEMYALLTEAGAKLVVTTPVSAELIKYVANCYLAMRISYFNEMSDVCEKAGADFADVAAGVGLDSRIGPAFMRPGPGYGGSCFPKDTLALAATAQDFGVPSSLVETAIASNSRRKASLAGRIASAYGQDLRGARVAVLGLAFKAETDDLRDSAALDLIPALQMAGAEVAAYDPEAMRHAARHFNDVAWATSAIGAAKDADVVVFLTEWTQFASLVPQDLKSAMRGNTLVDFRNLFDGVKVAAAGLDYHPIGSRPTLAANS